MSIEAKLKKYEEAIYPAAYGAAALGVPGSFIPVLDVGGMTTIWGTMIVSIAAKSNRQLDSDAALKFVTAILAGAGAYLGGTKVLTTVLHFFPGAGTIASVGLNCLLNFLYTFRLGRFVALQMEKPGFGTEDWAAMVPEITSMVFALPSLAEIQESWADWQNYQHYQS
jgi:hypothetical protein